jgi:hypothetical protein
VQAPYLTQAFSGASNALNTAQNNAVTPSQFTANYNPAALDAYTQEQQYGTGNTSIPGSSAGAGGALSTAGVGGVQNGLGGLAGFQSQGGTQSNIDAAMQYAGNAPISAMTQAAMQPAYDAANYNINPGIDRAAGESGNINSSRDAIQHGIVTKGLQQDATNTAANLTGQAYNTGLNLAQTNSQANNTNSLTALMAQLSGGTSATNAGTAANTGAVNNASGLFGIANAGSQGAQTAAQAPLTNAQQAFTANTNDPFAAYNNFMSLIGGNYGSQTTGTSNGTQTTTPSLLSDISSGVGIAGSLLSDARSKTDIQNVGTLHDGQNVYRYRYVGQPTWHIGLLAQEVEKLFPEAVTEIFGVKHVNYDLATRAAI